MAASTDERAKLQGWFAGRLPDGWFEGPPEVAHDRDEIVVVGRLAEPDYPEGDDDVRAATREARVQRFREETRDQRMRIAAEAERRTGRKVAWGAECGTDRFLFTHLSIPVMTRLRFRERQILDTLVEGGVARSRSDALAWCVRLVGDHQGDWIQSLRDSLVAVGEARRAGPTPTDA